MREGGRRESSDQVNGVLLAGDDISAGGGGEGEGARKRPLGIGMTIAASALPQGFHAFCCPLRVGG